MGACMASVDMAEVVNEASQECSICGPSCQEVLFQVDQSQAVWPSSSLWSVLAHKYGVVFANQTITEEKVLSFLKEGLASEDEANEYQQVRNKSH